jgi:drug/metabolite transporter (DMT)-like permease
MAKDLHSVLLGGLFCGLALMSASVTQQFGLQTTSVGKAGFISTLYIILVPIFGLFLKHRCRWTIWIAVILALIGLSFLCLDGTFRLQKGDLLLLASAALFAVHILTINHFVTQKNAVFMACLQFFTVGVLCLLPALLFERPTFQAVFNAKYSLLYAGLFSSGIAFTLQIVGQRGMNPTVASLLMSLESVVSVVAGFLFLGQIPSTRELIGCGITLIAVILAQIDFPAKKDPETCAFADKNRG